MALKAGNGSISARAQRAAQDAAERVGIRRTNTRGFLHRRRYDPMAHSQEMTDEVGGFLRRHPIAALSAAVAVGVAIGALLRS